MGGWEVICNSIGNMVGTKPLLHFSPPLSFSSPFLLLPPSPSLSLLSCFLPWSSFAYTCRSGVTQPGAARRPPSGMRGRIPTGGRPPYRMPTGQKVIQVKYAFIFHDEIFCFCLVSIISQYCIVWRPIFSVYSIHALHYCGWMVD